MFQPAGSVALDARPVVLVSLDWIRPGDPRTGLGTASIAAQLRAAHVPVEIVSDAVNRDGFCIDELLGRVERAIARAGARVLVGIGAYVWAEPEVQRLVAALSPRVAVVLGGPQVSYVEAGGLEGLYPGVRAFVRGFGERAMVALALGEAVPEGEHGIHHAGAVDLGSRADSTLDGFASPHLDGTLPPGPFVRWETQRGCVFRCTFCQHRTERPGRDVFARDRVLAEVQAFAEADVRRIAVLDPIFHGKRTRALDVLAEAHRSRLRAHLSLQCRFEMLDEPFLDGLAGLDTTLEFGLQTIHEAEGNTIQRANDMVRVERAVAALHERGIRFEVSLIYGLPQQTLASFQATLAWCANHRIPRVRAWPLMLLRGTTLHAQRDRWGFRERGDRIPIVVESHTFTEADHAEMARLADLVGGAS